MFCLVLRLGSMWFVSMKRIFFVIFSVILAELCVTGTTYADPMELIAEFSPPVPGAYVQGGTMTDKGLVMAYFMPKSSTDEMDKASADNPIMRLEIIPAQGATDVQDDLAEESGSSLTQGRSEVVAYDSLSHANDMCYVPEEEEIYVLPMDAPQVIVLDEDTLQIERKIEVSHTYHAIGYDDSQGCFVAVYASGKGKDKRLICDVLERDLKRVITSFPVDTNLTYQGLAVHDSRVFYSCWKKEEGKREHRTQYDDEIPINDNAIFIYDLEGNLLNAVLIHMPEGYNVFEIETVTFYGDKMIAMFNENCADENNTLMTGVYAVSIPQL